MVQDYQSPDQVPSYPSTSYMSTNFNPSGSSGNSGTYPGTQQEVDSYPNAYSGSSNPGILCSFFLSTIFRFPIVSYKDHKDLKARWSESKIYKYSIHYVIKVTLVNQSQAIKVGQFLELTT